MKPTSKLVNPTSDQAAGFHCNLCSATFTAYDAYLDHCNSRLHQRNLGTPTVERVDDVERIRARLKLLREQKAKKMGEDVVHNTEERMAQSKLDEDQRRRQKYENKKAKAKSRKDAQESSDEEKELMSSVLGISSFK